jgi:UDP-glucose 4-epimerase
MSGGSRPYERRRVLVTGATGFIGRWVARRLARQGADVVAAVRSPEAMHGIARTFGIEASIVALDCSDRDAVIDTLARLHPDVVFHLAGYGVRHGERDDELSRRVNVDSVRFVAEALARLGEGNWPGARLVHAGSALEYGTAGGHLVESSTCSPTTLYGRTKLEGTRVLSAVAASTGLRALTARLFTVFGPGEPDGRLLPSLIEAARTGQALSLTAGTQRRDFTYVEDAAEGLVRLGAANVPPGSIVNLATGSLHSVRQFVETAAAVLGIAPSRLRFGALPVRPEEMRHQDVSIDRLRAVTGWQPVTPIAEGVRSTWAFVRSHVAPGDDALLRAAKD